MNAQSAGEAGYQTFQKEGGIAAMGTARLWLMMDEHEDSIDDSWVRSDHG